MELVGKTVKHNTFGKGVITKKTNNIIEVDFSGDLKKFLFPDAFSDFISMTDQRCQTFIDETLDSIASKQKRHLEAELQERERLLRIRTLKVSPQSQAAFGFLENSLSEVKETWTVSTGKYLSGLSKGEPRVPNRLKLNSACLLTQCPLDGDEKDRQIVGAFMVQDNFEGNRCNTGVIKAHDKHRIILTPQESLHYWDYFSSTNNYPRWGHTEMKYFANTTMQQILNDMILKIKNPTVHAQAQEFYQYFCEVNKLPLLDENRKNA